MRPALRQRAELVPNTATREEKYLKRHFGTGRRSYLARPKQSDKREPKISQRPYARHAAGALRKSHGSDRGNPAGVVGRSFAQPEEARSGIKLAFAFSTQPRALVQQH